MALECEAPGSGPPIPPFAHKRPYLGVWSPCRSMHALDAPNVPALPGTSTDGKHALRQRRDRIGPPCRARKAKLVAKACPFPAGGRAAPATDGRIVPNRK